MRGQLKRESSPINGEKPGYAPQHDSTGNEDYVRTSPLNPLPIKDDAVAQKLEEIKVSTQNVKDVDVKAELELIKQQQAEILARLDNPIDTRLTGSLIEESLFTNTTIKAGSYVLKYVDLHDCNRYTIGVRNDGTGKFSIRTRLQSTSGEWYSGQTTLVSGDLFALTGLQTVTTGRLAIFIYNDGTVDAIIRESSINKIT